MVPFYLVILEIFIYLALAIWLIGTIYLIYGYCQSFLRKNRIISWIFFGVNVGTTVILLILVILSLLAIFEPIIFGNGDISNEATLLNIAYFGISTLILAILWIIYLSSCSIYFTIYQKNDRVYLFDSYFDQNKNKKIIANKHVLIYRNKIFFTIIFRFSKTYQYLTTK
ncbi:hypothetical protein S100390_v1c05810 [Spiroplasma sp. NBRC 100390]|uniref:hypothetical protein n=1 Tax=unclassified Spiroplasma TaxID=2637901 RepID=UPI00089297ED|nr:MULTISPECIES: hypothetical protein [unclassified Spiroplasma]AOX43918.1 hypothetical protein STU14_v1c05810 [Spiroplasma sp. TU-14]APE13388.1 hypothetical protein S100390_v1c05810 [Spiroplasma sp. NBRC 100390]